MNSLLCKQCIRKCCLERGIYPAGYICPNYWPPDNRRAMVEDNAAIRLEKLKAWVENAEKELPELPKASPTVLKNCESCKRFVGNYRQVCNEVLSVSGWRRENLMWDQEGCYIGVKPSADNCPGWQAKAESFRWCNTCQFGSLHSEEYGYDCNVKKYSRLAELKNWLYLNGGTTGDGLFTRLAEDIKSSCPGWQPKAAEIKKDCRTCGNKANKPNDVLCILHKKDPRVTEWSNEHSGWLYDDIKSSCPGWKERE